ncbi:flagellar protein FlgN [Geomonas sp. Red32]|uniref:flagellar protein FlgN n=1 Tax=Geomonas sp. Red32 TaxID=2912856 RepID=UPI00202CD09B|nr:flagellar protein FlgN [Geomonas sp. Red32]MCM0081166.1 flagellar protein FlgN [Geomonas sp. Red32]
MRVSIAELVAALGEKGSLMRELKRLLQVEQSCLVTLDLAKLEENQQQIQGAMEKLSGLSERCRGMIAALSAELGLSGGAALSPIIARLPAEEQASLREAQRTVAADSRELGGALALNRGLLEDSLTFVNQSVGFFNRLFNPGDTYGMAGSLVSRRGGSRFVCKEV